MSRRTRVSALTTAIALGCAAWGSERPALTQSSSFTYSVRDLGTFGGSTSSAHAVSQEVWAVAGMSTTASGATHAFAFRFYDGLQDLGTLGGNNSEVHGTDVWGSYFVGRAQTSTGRYHATFWDTAPHDLGTLGGPQSVAYSVNAEGVIVGVSDTAVAGVSKAFIVQGGVMSPLDVSLGGTTSAAYDINEAGSIVGTAALPGNTVSHAYLHSGGTTTDLGSPGGTSVATALNDAGDVVGYWVSTSGATTRAFLYRSGAMQTLPALGGPLTKPRGINEDGVIVGESDTSSGVRHAVIWRDGSIVDLNALIPPGSGWLLQAATAIERSGHIVGYGLHNGVRRAFLLTPPIDLQFRVGPWNDMDTNYPNPHRAGAEIPLSGVVINNTPYWATNITITNTLSGPVEYAGMITDNADCVQSGQTLTCRFRRAIGPGDYDRGILFYVRATAAGVFTHTASVTADQYDPNLSNNSASEQNTAVSLAALDVASPVIGGTPALSRATLTSPTPSGGATVRLTSSNTAVATVPSQFDVLPWSYGGLYREFYVTTYPVSAPTEVRISGTYGLVTVSKTLTVLPYGATPYGGTPHPLPGTIEGEDYDSGGEGIAYHDTTGGNRGAQYRGDGVDIEKTTDSGGGYNVGWAVAGEWLQYSVSNGTAGDFTLEARVASRGPGGTFHVEFNGVDVTGPITIPDTGGWQSWRTVTRTVTLSSGSRPLRVVFDTNGSSGGVGNLNWIRLAPAGVEATPFGGSPKPLPGTVQVEQFDNGGESVAYHDTTVGNRGGAYRQTDVDIEATTDAGGGHDVGWTRQGEWLAYTVDVNTAGTHTLSVRVASTSAGGTFHVEFNGVNKTGPLTVPATGGWQAWTTITKPVTLSAGRQSMRIVMDANSTTTGGVGNFNWVSVGAP